MQFVDGGKNFVCNLCSFKNPVPDFYFSNVDHTGRRLDWNGRPELRFGTVEFVAPADYSERPPKPAAYVFVLDVSYQAKQNGLISLFARTMKDLLDQFPTAGLEYSPVEIGFITFDRTVHFYNLSPRLSQPQMLVMSDVTDVFVPLEEGFLVRIDESREIIETLLTQLPTYFKDTVVNETAFGAAVQAASLALKKRGGRVMVFQSSLPNSGPGTLRLRDDPKLFGTEKEKTMFQPQDPFYQKLGLECAESGVSVDAFLTPTGYIDVATIGALTSITGGSTFYFPHFNAVKDKEPFSNELARNIKKTYGFEGLLRVRTSSGLKVKEYYGNFNTKNEFDLQLAGIDSESAIGVQLQHEGTLDEKTDSALQCAVLYTTITGQRRIRVINLSLANTLALGNVFKFAELDTIMNLTSKMALHQVASTNLSKIRQDIVKKCIQALLSYRKHCASQSAPGQLILPETLKLMPIYTSGLLKHAAFRGGSNISFDEKVYMMRLLKGAGVAATIPMFYPRMFNISDLNPSIGMRDENGYLIKPQYIRVSAERLNPQDIYVVENGRKISMWIGMNVPSNSLLENFGTGFVESIDTSMNSLPQLETEASKQLLKLLSQVRENYTLRYLLLEIVRQKQPQEVGFMEMNMVEDKTLLEMSYVDFLCYVHREIQNDLAN